MVSTGTLLILLAIATVTDVRWRVIPNWNVYSGIAMGVLMSAVATWWGVDQSQGTAAEVRLWGIVSLADALAGLFGCGAAMLACYVLFAHAVGGGDVKLVAMIGAFLGLASGLEAMLWTFVLAACQALILLVWRHGALRLVRETVRFAWLVVRTGGRGRLSEEERQPLQSPLFVSPSALLAVFLVRGGLLERLGG